jgi:hypothetical protein
MQYFRSRIAALVLAVMIAVVTARPASAQAILVVDDDGQATATDCNATQNAYSSIQDAVDAASAGGTIFVCPSVYDEQVVVTTSNLTILGSGMDTTIMRPSAVSVNSSGTSTLFPVRAILLISGATGVTVKHLTVDGGLADGGAGHSNCLQVGAYIGIYYRNSSGTVESTHVTNIRSATVCSTGLSASTGSGHVSKLVVKDSLFNNYGSDGMRCGGAGAVCRVTGNTFRGRGPVTDQIQGGIIFRGGAGGSITNNVITDHFYTPAIGIFEFSVGIGLFNPEPDLNPHLLQNNSFAGDQLNVQRQGTAQTVE